jgi:beta-glucosidase-like glycosyl hydrolase
LTRARLLLPALRCAKARTDPDPFLRLAARGVAGFAVFGGDAALGALLARLQAAAPHPLLFAADLEDGAGQQIAGATRHPPAAALFPDAAEAAGVLTAIEARAHGLTMAFAPVCDVVSEPRNPILCVRAFADPVAAAPRFVAAARAYGLRACAKHFPGHGATREDSHDALPVVAADARTWRARDLAPFAACFHAGVDATMTAHVDCPALTREPGLPATLSPRVMTDLLRAEMGFGGLAVSDALLMEGVRRGRSEAEAARLAVEAGCDLVICPDDVEGVLRALERVRPARVDEALARVAAASLPLPAPIPVDPAPLREALRTAARRSVRARGPLPLGRGSHALRICDLHGGGEALAAACGLRHERIDLEGRVLSRGEGPGLEAPAVALLRRDKAWGGPVDPPPAVARLLEAAGLALVLGPARLAEGLSAPRVVQAPGEDPWTVEAALQAAFGPPPEPSFLLQRMGGSS